MDDVIAQTINSSVSVADYQGVVKSYAPLPYDQNALGKLKQCFLDQSEETLANVQVMVVIIHFPLFVSYYYIYIYNVHIYTYIIYVYCTYLCILYISIYVYLYYIPIYIFMCIYFH
ncbi:Secretoglobin family 2A member 2 [Lemmus lemmus]